MTLKILSTVFGLDKEDKKRNPINLESLEITTNTGTVIIMANHPSVTRQIDGQWMHVIEYTDRKRKDVYRRHIIYLRDVVDMKFRYDGENIIE